MTKKGVTSLLCCLFTLLLLQSPLTADDIIALPDSQVETTEPPEPEFIIQCYECSNYNGDIPDPECPIDGSLGFDVPAPDCTGPCFTRSDASDQRLVIRGCTSSLPSLPPELPPDGCYDWEGATICLCYMLYCNMDRLGMSSGIPLMPNPDVPETMSTTITSPAETTTTSIKADITTTRGADSTTTENTLTNMTTTQYTGDTECMECSNVVNGVPNPDCPFDGPVTFLMETVKQCSGPCYHRTVVSEQKLIFRGCTSQLKGLPSVLPTDGCYDWEGATFCICSDVYCNADPVGSSIGLSLDYLDTATKTPSQTSADTSSANAAPQTSIATTTTSSTTTPQTSIATTTSSTPAAPQTSVGSTTTSTTTDPQTSKEITITTAKPAPPTTDGNFSIKCVDCRNYVEKTYYDWCPKYRMVNMGQVFFGDCNGPCFTRSDRENSELVVRGCTATQGTLPTPLPSEGCYDWNGATLCVCYTSQCNALSLGKSSGVPLDEHLINGNPGQVIASTTIPTQTSAGETAITTTMARPRPPTIDGNFNIKCADCRNYVEKTYYDWCPKDRMVNMGQVFFGKCNGPCFTRSDSENSELVVRGCAATQGTLPTPLPSEGCYDWNGATLCVCYTSHCNALPLGKSSGVPLDEHLINFDSGQDETEGPLHCYECVNYLDGKFLPQCPKNGRVNTQTVGKGNCTGACFTRSFSDDPLKVGRGCTSTQFGVPFPLPPSGCYNWNSQTWCICNTSYCNGGPIGVSSGKDLDEHLYLLDVDFEEPDGINKCYQCLSYFDGVNYPQCPKTSRVKNAFLAPCNGSCFTRTYDKDDRIIARGCSDSQYGLPKCMPPDGCYIWYTEVWCICSKSRCNGAALGTPKFIEFDSYVCTTEGDQASSINSSGYLFAVQFLALSCIFKWCFSPN